MAATVIKLCANNSTINRANLSGKSIVGRHERQTSAKINKQKKSATIYQSLYLANLLLLPGLSFIALIIVFINNKNKKGLARIHLYRALQLAILAGILLLLFPAIVILSLSSIKSSLMAMLVYFVTVHAALVLLGMLNIARAMAYKLPIF